MKNKKTFRWILVLSIILGLYTTAETINQQAERLQTLVQNNIENQVRKLQDGEEEKSEAKTGGAEGEAEGEAEGAEEAEEGEEAEDDDDDDDDAESNEESTNSSDSESESETEPSSSESSSESETSESQKSSSSEEEEQEEELPKVEFIDLTNYEHLRNFRAISGNLKAYEEEYIECLGGIPLLEFDEDAVDECVGRNFIKVLIDIKYVTMKTMSVGDSKIRNFMITWCFDIALETDKVDQEEFITGCDILEKDVLNMLWTGLSFVEIIETNREKYLSEYSNIPENIFEDLWDQIKPFSHEFFELLNEIDSHKEVTIIRLKNYIDDRHKMRQEEEEENGIKKDSEEPEEEPENGEEVDITESLVLDENQQRKLFPKFQTTKNTRGIVNGNRYLNMKAFNSEKKKQFVNSPKTENLYMMGGNGGKRQMDNAADRQVLDKGRSEFMKAQLQKLKQSV